MTTPEPYSVVSVTEQAPHHPSGPNGSAGTSVDMGHAKAQRPAPMSDRTRAALYRARQTANGGRRATVAPPTAALLRELLREALQRDTWTTDDRKHLESFLGQLKRD